MIQHAGAATNRSRPIGADAVSSRCPMPDQQQPLSGQVAVVTGASRGIGRAIAVEFARAGADVVVTARSSEKAPSRLPGTIEDTAREVEAAGRRPDGVATARGE